MTKAQLLKENEILRKQLRIVCTDPESYDALMIRVTEKFNKKTEDMFWHGNLELVKHNFGGFGFLIENNVIDVAGLK